MRRFIPAALASAGLIALATLVVVACRSPEPQAASVKDDQPPVLPAEPGNAEAQGLPAAPTNSAAISAQIILN